MKLYTYCKHCKEEINVTTKASDRGSLQMKHGDHLDLKCEECNGTNNKHVNDIKAEIKYSSLFVALGISILVTLILWFFIGAVSTLSLSIPLLYWKIQSDTIHKFNSYMVRRKPI